jgi:murein DD-endopeptidase MepM/ murein hydrolase activator NlpD
MRFCVTLAVLMLATSPIVAAEPTFIGRFEQGGLVIGQAEKGAEVSLNGKPVAVTPTGAFVLGFDRDAAATAELTIKGQVGAVVMQSLAIAPRQWQIERVDGLPQKLVTPDPQTEAQIAEDNTLMVAARTRTEPVPFYESGFMRPAQGRISGVFGSQRILNGIPRAPHMGLDIAGPVGTPVVASADGIVSLAKPDMVLTGQTVIIEHGFGLDTVYIHMSDIKVVDGQRVKQGDVIGAIGQTGRATGPHLHFGVTWFNTRLDPETVLAVLPAIGR